MFFFVSSSSFFFSSKVSFFGGGLELLKLRNLRKKGAHLDRSTRQLSEVFNLQQQLEYTWYSYITASGDLAGYMLFIWSNVSIKQYTT